MMVWMPMWPDGQVEFTDALTDANTRALSAQKRSMMICVCVCVRCLHTNTAYTRLENLLTVCGSTRWLSVLNNYNDNNDDDEDHAAMRVASSS